MENYNYKGFKVSVDSADNIFLTLKAVKSLKSRYRGKCESGLIIESDDFTSMLSEAAAKNENLFTHEEIERAFIITVNCLYIGSELESGYYKASEMINRIIDEYDEAKGYFSAKGLKMLQNKEFIGANKIVISLGDLTEKEN